MAAKLYSEQSDTPRICGENETYPQRSHFERQERAFLRRLDCSRHTAARQCENALRLRHTRSACQNFMPPLVYGCNYMGFTSSRSDLELITRRIIQEQEGDMNKNLEAYATTDSPEYKRMVEIIRTKLGLTSLRFNTVENLVKAIGLPKCQICTHCFDGSSYF